ALRIAATLGQEPRRQMEGAALERLVEIFRDRLVTRVAADHRRDAMVPERAAALGPAELLEPPEDGGLVPGALADGGGDQAVGEGVDAARIGEERLVEVVERRRVVTQRRVEDHPALRVPERPPGL